MEAFERRLDEIIQKQGNLERDLSHTTQEKERLEQVIHTMDEEKKETQCTGNETNQALDDARLANEKTATENQGLTTQLAAGKKAALEANKKALEQQTVIKRPGEEMKEASQNTLRQQASIEKLEENKKQAIEEVVERSTVIEKAAEQKTALQRLEVEMEQMKLLCWVNVEGRTLHCLRGEFQHFMCGEVNDCVVLAGIPETHAHSRRNVS